MLDLQASWNWGFQVTFSLLCCYGSLHVLRYFVHWNWCIKAVCSTVLCCNSIVFCETASADRNGMAAPRLSKGTCSSVAPCESDCVLRIVVGRLHWNCYLKDAIWMLGFARNIAICQYVFSGQPRFRCGEKLARLRDGCGRRRFSAKSCLICARTVTKVSK